VAFSEAQQDEIESALQPWPSKTPHSAPCSMPVEREENVSSCAFWSRTGKHQGDERDMCSQRLLWLRPEGKMLMNFGRSSKTGGEKRLNVAFSRGKRADGGRQLDHATPTSPMIATRRATA